MVIYEVNLRVDEDISTAFEDWLNGHVVEMLAIEGFLGVQRFDRLDPPPSGGAPASRWWTLHYALASEVALENYLMHHAARMRDEGLARFEGRFEATRRVLRPREDP